MKRTLETKIKADLDQKIVLLSGPRQVGKTTLARALFPDTSEYFNGFFGKKTEPILLVKNLKRELFFKGVKVKKAGEWLETLEV